MSGWQRFSYLLKANVHAMLDRAEDPERMRRALVHEIDEALDSAREAGAELKAEMDGLRQHQKSAQDLIDRWRGRAESAVSEGQDDLARTALSEAQKLEREQREAEMRLAHLGDRQERLAQQVAGLKDKRQQMAQHKPGAPAAKPGPSAADVTLNRADRRFNDLEARLRRLEARVESYDEPVVREVPASADIEAELQQLKAKNEEAA
ncbi:MAG: phage shock protein PspA [Lysobacteraceae bacterium]|nr:MAG: phage shock protein PspA [Xanthomonadaceae bacterium]